MKTITLLLILAATASAQSPPNRGRPGYAYSRETAQSKSEPSREDGEDTTSTPPQSVPEPSSPVVMLALAGAALIGRRARK